MKKGYQIILWGIGVHYNRMKRVIDYYEMTKQFRVVALTDREKFPFSQLDGYKIIEKNELQYIDFDYLIVLSDKYFDDIVLEAERTLKIERSKILRKDVLLVPNLNFNDYIMLKESDISIISNNCWGGTTYKTLGLQCRSPFKNLFVLDNDYIKLLSNLEYYLGLIPQFDHFSVDCHSNIKYPVLKLDDISIHCNHTADPKEAISNWNRRNELVNFENLFVEMYTENVDIAEQFETLEKYEKRICFVPYDVKDKNHLAQLHILSNQSEFWETVNANATIGKNAIEYNLLDLLLYGKIKYRGRINL